MESVAEKTITVRNLYQGERWPEELNTGFEGMPVVDEHWIWVAIVDEEIKGILITAPAQGFVNLLRACASADAPKHWLLQLLRHAAQQARERGYVGWVGFFDATQEISRRIAGTARKMGGIEVGRPFICVWGLTDLKRTPECKPLFDFLMDKGSR